MRRYLTRRVLGALAIAAAAAATIVAAKGPGQEKGDAYSDVDRFVSVLQHIRSYYVDDVDDEELLRAAIKRMLGDLDPHTQFLESSDLRNLRVGTTGKYSGLGIEVSTRRGYPIIVSPMEGTPAQRAGLQTGDLIVAIDGDDTFGMLLQDVSKALRGPAGTSVNLTVRRKGEPEVIEFNVVRDIIHIPNISTCAVIGGDVGYVRLTHYAAGTASELDACFEELESRGVRGMILDLRGNPGGLLLEAVSVCEQFLPQGKLLVFTRGRVSGESVEYISKSPRSRKDIPLVLLVDGGTASAAEIVAGAIQDWDLGLIVGTATFGKGSVQRVMDLGGDQALKLTTSYYYTPSGRCIHKKTEDEEPLQRIMSGVADEPVNPQDEVPVGSEGGEEFRTAGGRTVLGSGGITPDLIVEPTEIPRLAAEVERRRLPFNFAVGYIARNPEMLRPEVTDEMMISFKEFILDEGVSFDEGEYEAAGDALSLAVSRELSRGLHGDEEATLVALGGDRMIQVAVEILSVAERADDLFREAAARGESVR